MRRRRRGLPDRSEQIVERELAHWARLDDGERARLLELTDWLLQHKHWEASGGFELTDTIRLVIAVQAALLILGLTPDHYRLVSSIIVYPSTAISTGERAGPVAGTRTDEPLAIHGLAQARRGPVLVAWDQAQAAARHPERGHNVVIHEFAHKLDMLDGLVDGTPPIDAVAMKPWVAVCTEVFEDLRAGRPRPPLRPYGATNPGEFFAVATEAFFDVADDLARHEPELYRILADFYRQDPPVAAARRLTARRPRVPALLLGIRDRYGRHEASSSPSPSPSPSSPEPVADAARQLDRVGAG